MGHRDTFRILALDGGGTRGIYTAQILTKIEQTFGVQIRTCFDLVAGTSTGAILAGAVVSDIPMHDILGLFETETPHIFRRRWYRTPLFFSKYRREPLAQALAAHLPATPLGNIDTPLVITSSNIAKGVVHIFRSSHGDEGSDKDLSLRDAILASCAAPIFFSPKSVHDALFADGALWANNPSTIAIAEAVSGFDRTPADIRMLSIGTGQWVNMYRPQRSWGLLTGWGGAKLVSSVMMLQSQASAQIAKQLLKANYLRINAEIDFWGVDTLVHLDTLKSLALRDFESRAAEIERFLFPYPKNTQ